MQSLVDQEGVLSIKVPRQDCRLIEIKVKEANSKVEWVFETPTKDIAVGFYLKKNDDSKDDMVELLQTERVFCHLVPESGAYICETPGTCKYKYAYVYTGCHISRFTFKSS